MNNIDTIFWLTLTVYYEARGESALGRKNVAKVILNRAKKNNWPIANVVLARKQFSCYNKGLSAKLLWVKEIPKFIEIHETVKEAFYEWNDGDILGGATHYYAIKGMKNQKPPWWAPSMQLICEVEGHRFLKEN